VIKTDSVSHAPVLQQLLNRELSNAGLESQIAAYRWDELLPGLRQAINLDMVSAWFFYGGLVLVVTCGIINTFLMSVLERTREFGLMLSLGATPYSISKLIFLECTMLTLAGLIVGMILGTAVVVYFGITGFIVPGSEEVLKMWNLPGAVYTEITPLSLTLGPVVILIAALLSIIYPVLQVWRLRPVEAMRSI
jgi:ABC-type lipoprotein release transport system permease subunit